MPEKKIIPWTSIEDMLIKELYPNTARELLIEKTGRTWKAIRCRAAKLGIQRSSDVIKNDNVRFTKKAMLQKYGVEYSTLLPSMKEKTRQTNLKRRGVEYPTQSEEVRDKVKETVQEKYGVENVFQAKEIKEKITQTLIETYGVTNPLKNKDIQDKVKRTNLDKYGVENPFQIKEKVREGMKNKYGEEVPLKIPKIIEKKKKTSLQKYGFEVASKSESVRKKLSRTLSLPEIKEKRYSTLKRLGKFSFSVEETNFLQYLLNFDPNTKAHQLHPEIKHVIDFFMPLYNIWVQYDGDYWHGRHEKDNMGPQAESIKKIREKDNFQNRMIPNLVRFWSEDVKKAINDKTIVPIIESKLKEKTESLQTSICHQYKKKLEFYTEDLKNLPFDTNSLKASDFDLSSEAITTEIILFIKRYEWLGTIGFSPKWCFTARYHGILGGVVLINEPTAYSKILGKDTPIYEALIQRGASASWTPKNLGSRLVMFSCTWMVNNTSKRVFIGYSDPSANERGIIYQACNFDYLGDSFGNSYLYKHPDFPRVFSSHDLKRTSYFRSWCLKNKVSIDNNWFRSNGMKDLSNIPETLKIKWYSWIKEILSNSEKIKIEKKGKYAIVLYKDKKEKKLLESLKCYKKLPYKKDPNDSKKDQYVNNNVPIITHGKTRDRKNEIKINFIIENHYKMSKSEIAIKLNETERWVKRQIARLIKEKAISSKKSYRS
jgi:hypothetical protein